MKYAVWLAALMLLRTTNVFAQETTIDTAANAASIQISDSEAVGLIQTIEAYFQGVTGEKTIKTFDRKKGQEVNLRFERVVTDDPERVVFPAEGQVAVSVECTEVKVKDVDKEDKKAPDGDKYEVWFLMERGNYFTSRVLDVIVKSVNGKPMYKWTKGEDGKFTATLVPDSAE